MVHILKNSKSEFYWLTIVKKGNTFEENGRSTEGYAAKPDCKKSAKNEVKALLGGLPIGWAVLMIDHTLAKDPRKGISNEQWLREIAFVQKMQSKKK
jgi:hypothetical protein